MAALGIVVYTALMIAAVVLDRTGLLQVTLGYNAGVEAYSLFSILFIGLIPIVTASILIIAFKPTSAYVIGLAPHKSSYASAAAAGFFIGMFIWCVTQLISTFETVFGAYLAPPAIWEHGMYYFGKTPLSSLVVLLVAVLLPAASIELLARGLIQQAFLLSGSNIFAGTAVSLLFALSFFDINGLIILTLWGGISFWIRSRTDSLIASSLGTAFFALAMIFARSIFTTIGQLLFRMPLIEPSKVRAYLLMCCFILTVLLLIPTALINETGRRLTEEASRLREAKQTRKRDGKGNRKGGVNPTAHYALRAVALLSTAVMAALVFLL